MYANVTKFFFFSAREVVHVGHKRSDREIEQGNVPPANTI